MIHSLSESLYFTSSLIVIAVLSRAFLRFKALSIIISVEFQRVTISGISSSFGRFAATHC